MQIPPEVLLVASRFRVERRVQATPDGRQHAREVVIHPGAVTIVPILADGRICLIRNVRIAVEETLIELPAGTLDAGEDPRQTAHRELIEETGYHAQQIEPLCQFFMSPGILNERMFVFVATGLTPGPMALEAGEQIEPLLVTRDESLELIEIGQIRDAKSIAALLFYDRFWQRQR
jgi:ADP-ribose pyrophosphatase